jgi:hypothetical protein
MESKYMNRPDLIVLVIDFPETHKFKLQVTAKNFILGEPGKGIKGDLEQLVTKELKKELISCFKFSLVKFPIYREVSRAVGVIGLFHYIGSEEEVLLTLSTMKKICEKFSKNNNAMWKSIEIYTAERWGGVNE